MTPFEPHKLEKLFTLSDETSKPLTITHPPILGFAESEWMKISNEQLFEATGILLFHKIGSYSLRLHCPNIPQKVSKKGALLPIEPLVYELVFEEKILITMQGIVLQFNRGGQYGEITNVDYRFFDLWLPNIEPWVEKCNDQWLKDHTKNLRKGNLWQRIVAAGLLCHRLQDTSLSIHDVTSPRQLALNWSAKWSAKSTIIVKNLLLLKLTILLKKLHALDCNQNTKDLVSTLCKLVQNHDDITGVTLLLHGSIPPDIHNLRQMCNHLGSKILKTHQITIEDVYQHPECNEQVLRTWITLTWQA